MRLTACLTKRYARSPQNEKKVIFKEMTPLSLNNHVRGSSKIMNEKKCLYEMSLLFICMSDSDFDNSACKEQFNNYNSCIKNYQENKRQQKHLQKIGIPTPDTVTFTDSQITYLLKKFPTK